MKKWTIDDSKELYNICGWGTSYFSINEKGNMCVSPLKDGVADSNRLLQSSVIIKQ